MTTQVEERTQSSFTKITSAISFPAKLVGHHIKNEQRLSFKVNPINTFHAQILK